MYKEITLVKIIDKFSVKCPGYNIRQCSSQRRLMLVTTLCLVCSISLPPSIRWTTMFWPIACRGRTGSARPRLIGFSPPYVITDRQFSTTGSFQPSTLSAVASLKVPCSGRCCSCSTPPMLVRLLGVSAYHLTSTPMTLSFTRGALHRQFHSSSVIWNLVLSGSPNGCVPTDCVSTPRRRTSCGAQPADGVSILTPVS